MWLHKGKRKSCRQMGQTGEARRTQGEFDQRCQRGDTEATYVPMSSSRNPVSLGLVQQFKPHALRLGLRSWIEVEAHVTDLAPSMPVRIHRVEDLEDDRGRGEIFGDLAHLPVLSRRFICFIEDLEAKSLSPRFYLQL